VSYVPILVGAVLLTAVGAPPSSAAPATTTAYYLALGDSLATGGGATTGQSYVDDIFNDESAEIRRSFSLSRVSGLARRPYRCPPLVGADAMKRCRDVTRVRRSRACPRVPKLSVGSVFVFTQADVVPAGDGADGRAGTQAAGD
jgi:hypothetical protein